jgi:AraC-like DNA-binding protein
MSSTYALQMPGNRCLIVANACLILALPCFSKAIEIKGGMTSLTAIRTIARRHTGTSALPRLQIHQIDYPTEIATLIYEPVVCLILQGSKRTLISDQVLEYGPGQFMIVAAEVTATGQIWEASPDEPYLAMHLSLDTKLISDLLLDMSGITEPPLQCGFGVSEASRPLLDAWLRLVELLDRPAEIPVMAAHLEHELMFRLLLSSKGALLRQIGGSDSRLSHIRRAMAWVRERYADHLTIETMADVAGMSISVFHRHFKAVTGLSPLQYQKHIRLHEARRRMVAERAEAATVGFSVGYESASQFSREYKRLFGRPPRRDVETIIESVGASH